MLIAAALLLFTFLCAVLSDDLAWDNVTRATRNELVFEGRHRSYGAFELRRDYDRRFLLALILGAGVLGVAGLSAFVLQGNAIPVVPKGPEVIIDITPPPDIPNTDPDPPKPPAAAPTPPAAGGAGTILVIDSSRVDIDTASTPPAPNPGPSGPGTGPVGPPLPAGSPGGTGSGSTTLLTDTMDIGLVQERPEFPGGDRGMYDYIQRHVRFPETVETQSRIYVAFVVDVDGSVVRVEAKNGKSNAYAKEAERLIRQMPRWSPAKMNGHSVKCRLVLPISFETK